MGESVEKWVVIAVAVFFVLVFVKPIFSASKDGIQNTANQIKDSVPKRGGGNKGGGNNQQQ